MERPKFNDQMKKELAQIVGEIVFEWCGAESSLERCIADSESVLQRIGRNEDGYTLAKEFEDKGYSSNSSLVDELDQVPFLADEIIKKHIQQWVKDNNLKLDIEVGTEVKYNEWKDRHKIGKVVKHYPETMQYGIRTPDQPESSHYVVNAEKVTLMAVADPS